MKAYYYQLRVCDELYNQIKKDSRLNIDNSINFPLLSFVDKNGKLIQYNKMPLEMQQHFDYTYKKVEFLKNYKNYKEYIDELTKYWGEEFWESYHKLYDKKQNRGTQFFKNWFIKRSRLLLKTYFHYMLSAASAYYDEIEEKMKESTAFKKFGGNNVIKK